MGERDGERGKMAAAGRAGGGGAHALQLSLSNGVCLTCYKGKLLFLNNLQYWYLKTFIDGRQRECKEKDRKREGKRERQRQRRRFVTTEMVLSFDLLTHRGHMTTAWACNTHLLEHFHPTNPCTLPPPSHLSLHSFVSFLWFSSLACHYPAAS